MEGTSDATCLIDTLELLLDSNPELRELCLGGDLTLYQTYSLGYANISHLPPLGAVRQVIREQITSKRAYTLGELLAIVQIMDLDGAMIPDDHITYSPNGLVYHPDTILTSNVDQLIQRNHRKTETVHALTDSSGLMIRISNCSIPYFPFYMSRNLEHVFWNETGNLSPRDKTRRARLKAIEYAHDLGSFTGFVESDEILHGYASLAESWEWPFIDCNSPHRGSNIAFLPETLKTVLERNGE